MCHLCVALNRNLRMAHLRWELELEQGAEFEVELATKATAKTANRWAKTVYASLFFSVYV